MMYTILDGIGGSAAIDRPDGTASAQRDEGGFARVFDEVTCGASETTTRAAAAGAAEETQDPSRRRDDVTGAGPSDDQGVTPPGAGTSALEARPSTSGASEETSASSAARSTDDDTAEDGVATADHHPIEAGAGDANGAAAEAGTATQPAIEDRTRVQSDAATHAHAPRTSASPELGAEAALAEREGRDDDPIAVEGTPEAHADDDERTRHEAEARAVAMWTTAQPPTPVTQAMVEISTESPRTLHGMGDVGLARALPTTTTPTTLSASAAGAPASDGGVDAPAGGPPTNARVPALDAQRAMRTWRAAAANEPYVETSAVGASSLARATTANVAHAGDAPTRSDAATPSGPPVPGELQPPAGTTRRDVEENVAPSSGSRAAEARPAQADVDAPGVAPRALTPEVGVDDAQSAEMRSLVEVFGAAMGTRDTARHDAAVDVTTKPVEGPVVAPESPEVMAMATDDEGAARTASGQAGATSVGVRAAAPSNAQDTLDTRAAAEREDGARAERTPALGIEPPARAGATTRATAQAARPTGDTPTSAPKNADETPREATIGRDAPTGPSNRGGARPGAEHTPAPVPVETAAAAPSPPDPRAGGDGAEVPQRGASSPRVSGGASPAPTQGVSPAPTREVTSATTRGMSSPPTQASAHALDEPSGERPQAPRPNLAPSPAVDRTPAVGGAQGARPTRAEAAAPTALHPSRVSESPEAIGLVREVERTAASPTDAPAHSEEPVPAGLGTPPNSPRGSEHVAVGRVGLDVDAAALTGALQASAAAPQRAPTIASAPTSGSAPTAAPAASIASAPTAAPAASIASAPTIASAASIASAATIASTSEPRASAVPTRANPRVPSAGPPAGAQRPVEAMGPTPGTRGATSVTSTPARGSALAPIRARLGAEHETIDVPALSRAGVSDDAGREQTRTDALTPAATTAPAGPTYTPERAAGPTRPMAASAHGDAPGPGVDPTVTLRAPRAERPEATFAAREDSASVLGEDPRRAAPTHDAPQSAAEAPIAAPGSDEAEGRDAGSDPRGDERAAPTERRRERRGVTARGDDLEPRFEPTRAAEAPKAEGASAPPRGSDPSERTAEPMVAERSPPQASSVERGRAPSGGLDGTPALRAYAEPREDEGIPTGRVGARRAAITIGEGDERVTLAVDAAAGRVTVEATAHSPGVARALAEYRGELRDALRDLGLELGGFSASTGGGQPSPQRETRDERGAPERDDLRNPSSAALGEGAPRTTGGRRPGVRVVV